MELCWRKISTSRQAFPQPSSNVKIGPIGGRHVMTPDAVDRARRMLEKGATRQQVPDVTGVGVKTIYKYLLVQYGDKKSP